MQFKLIVVGIASVPAALIMGCNASYLTYEDGGWDPRDLGVWGDVYIAGVMVLTLIAVTIYAARVGSSKRKAAAKALRIGMFAALGLPLIGLGHCVVSFQQISSGEVIDPIFPPPINLIFISIVAAFMGVPLFVIAKLLDRRKKEDLEPSLETTE